MQVIDEEQLAALVDRPCLETDVITAEDLVCVGDHKTAMPPRREKSLGSLCQRFVCIFLLGRHCLCLDEAAKVLMRPEEIDGPAKLRTKIRRLYDVANVLCTLGLLEKVLIASTKKPGFVWLGPAHVPSTAALQAVSAGCVPHRCLCLCSCSLSGEWCARRHATKPTKKRARSREGKRNKF